MVECCSLLCCSVLTANARRCRVVRWSVILDNRRPSSVKLYTSCASCVHIHPCAIPVSIFLSVLPAVNQSIPFLYWMVELEWASEWQALMLGLVSVIIAVMTRGVQIARNCCYKCLFPLMNHANIVGKGNQRQQQNIIISILLSLSSFNCSCSSGSSILHIRDQIGDIWASWYLVVLYRRRKWVIYQFQSCCNIPSLILQPQYITTILQQKSINTNNTLSRGTDTCVIQSVYTSYKHTPQ